ncbi:MAG: SRPBCC family protein [Nocardioidaceae bacterium]
MAERTDDTKQGGFKSLLGELPFDRLKDEAQQGLSSLGQRAVDSAGDRLTGLTEKLTDVSNGGPIKKQAVKGAAEAAAEDESPVKGALKGGLSGAKDKVKQAFGGGGGGGSDATKSTNMIEEIDVGVPVRAAYNQWTQFQDYSKFMKKVEDVDQQDEVKLDFKAQVFWSHRKWEATIIEQVPDERIVWRSKGEKGHVDGSVTFHELAPRLTRIVVVMEYYPQGLFERTGNIWRAQGRRMRLELKHFRRHLMMLTEDELEELEGWRGEIRDEEVVREHDEVVAEEESEDEPPEDEYDEEPAEDEEEPAEDEYEEDEYEEEPAEDEYDEEPAEDEEEKPRRQRSRR